MRRLLFALLAGCSLGLWLAQAAPPPKPDLLPPLIGPVSGATTDLGDLRWQGSGPNFIENGSFDEPLEKGWEPNVLFGGSWHRTNRLAGPAAYSNSPVVFRRLVQTPPSQFLWRAELVQTITLPQSSSLVLSWDDLTAATSSTRDIYQMEIRDADDGLLFIGLKVPYQTGQRWTRRSVELSPWAGRTVRLAWVLSNFEFNGDVLALDNMRLEAAPTDGTMFEVFFGPRTTFAATNLIARTTALTAAPPVTRNGVSNYWRVVAVRNGETNASGTSVFQRSTTATRRFYVNDTNGVPPVVGEARQLQVLLRTDPTVASSESSSLDLVLRAEDAHRPTVVLSEVRFGPKGGIELMNVTDTEQDISQWRLAWTDERGRGQRRVNIPDHVSLAAGETLVLRGQAAAGEETAWPFPQLMMDRSFWPNQPTNAVLVLAGPPPENPNARRSVIDCLFLGDARWLNLSTGEDGAFYVVQHDLPESEWPQVGVGMLPGATGLRRVFRRDSNSAGDWKPTYGAGEDWGYANPELIGPWQNGPGRLLIGNQPTAAVQSGRWQGQSTPQQGGHNAFFQATQPPGQGGINLVNSSVAWPHFQVQESRTVEVRLPVSVTEGGAAVGSVELARAVETNLVLQLSAQPAGRLGLPATVTIPAGQRAGEFSLSVPNDQVFQGAVAVRVQAQGEEWTSTGAETLVYDDEAATLQLTLPPSLAEGTTGNGLVSLPSASAFPVTVSLHVSEPTLRVRASVVIPAGTVEAAFEIQRFSDPFLEGTRSASVFATLGSQPAVSAPLALPDDESSKIGFAALTGGTSDKPLMEGSTTPLKGKVRLGGYSHTNVSIKLTSTEPDRLQLWTAEGTAVDSLTVVVDRAATEVAFEVVALDNNLRDGRHSVTLRAEAAGLDTGTLEIVIADNDPTRLTLWFPPSPQHQGIPFQFSWRALNVDGESVPCPIPPITYTRRLVGPDGQDIPIGVTSSQLFGETMASNEDMIPSLPAMGARVRIEVAGLVGESAPFNILPAPANWTALTNLVAFTVDTAQGEIVALAGSAGLKEPVDIVRIKPAQRSITRIATTPAAPGQVGGPVIELSADGLYIFTVGGETERYLWVFRAADGQLIERRSLVGVPPIWNLMSLPPPPGVDWWVLAQVQESRLVSFAANQQVPTTPTDIFWPLTFSPDRQRLFSGISSPQGPKLAELFPTPAGTVGSQTINWAFQKEFDGRWPTFRYSEGRLFDGFGESFDLVSHQSTPARFETPSTAFVLDPVRREVVFARKEDASWPNVQPVWSVYSTDSQNLIGSTVFPLERELARVEWVSRDWCALNERLQFQPDINLLRLVSLPLVSSDTNPADLKILVEAPIAPFKAGQDSRWRVTVTNQGPQAATDVQLKLTPLSLFWWISPNDPEGTGSEGSPPDRYWFGLAPGESHTFDMVLRPYGPGVRTLQFLATANETDPHPENNADTRTTVVLPAVSPPELPVTDVQLTARIVSPPLRKGDSLTMLLTVTNHGPEIATNVVCSVQYQGRMTPLKAVPSSHVPGDLKWTIPILEPGATRTFSTLLRCDVSGPVIVSASAGNASSFNDPNLANNDDAVSMFVGFSTNSLVRILGKFEDVVFDDRHNRLWISGHPDSTAWPDSLVALNLESGEPDYILQPGPSPGRMALTDDGNHLWVETEQGARLHRINLETGNVELAFGTAEEPPFQEFIYVTALLPLPGETDGIGLVRIRKGQARFRTFKAGQPEFPVLPLEGVFEPIGSEGFMVAALGSDGALVTGQRGSRRALRWSRNAAGYEFSGAADLGPRHVVGASAGTFILSDGSTLNPHTLTVNPIDPQLATEVVTATVEPQRGWIWVGKPGTNGQEWELQWRELSTGLVLGSTNLVDGIAVEILPIGGQRIVTRHEDRLDIRTLSMLPADPPTDLGIIVHPHLEADGHTAVFEFNVDNHGAHPANHVKVEYAITVTPGKNPGTFSRATLDFGQLDPGQVRSQSISVSGAWEGLEITASAAVHGSAEEAYPPDNFDRGSMVVPWVFNPFAFADFQGNILLWSPTAFRIITLLQSNGPEVVQLDPRTGVSERRTPLTGVSDLAVSPAGEWLFAVTQPENAVQRLRLPEMDEKLTVPVAAGIEEASPPQAAKVCALPDGSGGFAVLFQDGRVRLFDGRTPRRWLSSREAPLAANAMLLATQDRVIVLNGRSLRSLVVSSNGTIAEFQRELSEVPLNFSRAGELLVFSTGDVVRSQDLTLVTHLPVRGWVTADSLSETATFLTTMPDPERFELRVLRLSNGETITSQELLAAGNSRPAGLVRWGARGFAALVGDIFGSFTAPFGQFATSPIPPERDSDADGIFDVVELEYGLSPAKSDLVADFDGDGYSNAAELAAGTDFRSAISPLRVGVETTGSPAGTFNVRFATDSKRRFVLETAPTPSGPWTEFGHPFVGDGNYKNVDVPAAGTPKFVRLQTSR